MKKHYMLIPLLFAIICFFYGIFRIVQSEIIIRSDIETVKTQLQQSERGIVTITRPDRYLIIVFSVFSLIVGVVIGFLIKKS